MKILKNDLNLEITRGDTLSFGVEIYKLGKELDTCKFSVKSNYDDQVSLFEKNLNDGIQLDHIADEDYFYKVRVAPEDTKDLDFGQYYYDLEIGVNQDIFTISRGVLTLEPDVSQTTPTPARGGNAQCQVLN